MFNFNPNKLLIMKSIKVILAALVLVAFSFSSCSKDEESSGPADGTGKVNIAGSSADFSMSIFTSASSAGYSATVITIATNTQNSAEYQAFMITFAGIAVEKKTYDLSKVSETSNVVLVYYKGMTSSYNSNDYYVCYGSDTKGTVTITEVTDQIIKGSFKAEVINVAGAKKTVSGDFSAKNYASYKQ
jgi:hypothetical protein